MRQIPAVAAAALLLVTLPGCSGTKKPATYHPPPQKVREYESALAAKQVTIGEVSYTAIALRTDIYSVIGSHADQLAKGRYARVRIRMINNGKERHDFDVFKQLMITKDGQSYKPSYDAMQISRAPFPPFSVAAQELREFDLWYDIPVAAKVSALRITGDPSSSKLEEQLKGGTVPGSKSIANLPLTK